MVQSRLLLSRAAFLLRHAEGESAITVAKSIGGHGNPQLSFDSFSPLHILRSVSPPVLFSMPKPQSEKTQNSNPVTEARLEKLLSEQTKNLEQLLADQANVILEAVDEKMDKKMDQKLDPVINKLDAILGEVQKHREEDVIGAQQLRRHDDQLQDHAVRIKKLETIHHP